MSALYRILLAWSEFDLAIAKATGRNPNDVAQRAAAGDGDGEEHEVGERIGKAGAVVFGLFGVVPHD